MSDDMKPKTKREALLMREAYVRGCDGSWSDRHEVAARLYPIPTRTVTRPREVVRDGMRFSSNGHHVDGAGYNRTFYTGDYVRMLADLLANPTETVEVEVDE